MAFDFDTWAHLAKHDKDEFERRRQAAVEQLIASAPPASQRRLRGLQFRIDMERRRAVTPLGACVRISEMMWDSVFELHDALNGLPKKPSPSGDGTSAIILQLREP
ncbi:MAG: DUF3135 domain-containing protein [Burkholderiales bacterium]|nr:DUF3135 domain-containing protein [Burkholderiales bacterium]MDQ3195440.1 DUF3135 domain-containing protein [Pseudomonadota bacterium]